MAKPKEARNRQFVADWKGKGLSDEELRDKYSLSPGGLKALKARLRKKDPSLYVKSPASKQRREKATSPSRQVATETEPRRQLSEEREKMAFWLPRTMKEKLKILAVKEKRTASDIVREILRKSLE